MSDRKRAKLLADSSNNAVVGSDEEPTVTMFDVLKEADNREKSAQAVLGSQSTSECTYDLGYMKRQPLYSCLTCAASNENGGNTNTMPSPSETLRKQYVGICLACSVHCHDTHNLVELYTKRQFKCDCRTSASDSCKLLVSSGGSFSSNSLGGRSSQKELENMKNTMNRYNQNFEGLYCVCHKPYPCEDDSDVEIEHEESNVSKTPHAKTVITRDSSSIVESNVSKVSNEDMIQCSICEDWFHLSHLKMNKADQDKFCEQQIDNNDNDDCQDNKVSVDDDSETIHSFGEMICHTCVTKYNWLDEYRPCFDDDSKASKTDSNDEVVRIGGKVSKLPNREFSECPIKGYHESEANVGEIGDHHNSLFITTSDRWRKTLLCRCIQCMRMYERENLKFLLDYEDSVQFYEAQNKENEATSQYEKSMEVFSSVLDRTAKVEFISKYNNMKSKLTDYLKSFAETDKVITQADIQNFFAKMKEDDLKNGVQDQNGSVPKFCRF